MYPVIHIFGINIYPYGLMIGIGLIAAIFLFMKRCKSRGYDEDTAFNLAFLSGISGILGAKVFYILIEFPEIIKDPSMIIKDFSNGFVFYGGIFFGILTGYLYSRFKKWPFLRTLDLAAPSIPLAHAFGRMGCFFAGCCYGKETDSFIGIEFNNSPFAPHDVHLIPTQAISSIGNLVIFAVLLWFDNRRKTKNGQTGALYLILYSIFRFVVEIFRGDPRGTVFNIFSTSQFICIFVFAIGVFLMFWLSKMPQDGLVEAAAGGEPGTPGTINEEEIEAISDNDCDDSENSKDSDCRCSEDEHINEIETSASEQK